MKKLFVFATVLALSGAQLWGDTSPSEVNIKMYEVWVSPNSDCSNAVQFYEDDSPSYQNVVGGPTFGEGALANGTYPCIMWRMGDVITFRPVGNTTNCTAGTLYTRDLFRAPSSATGPDGSTLTGSGDQSTPIENTMWIYLKVGGTNGPGGNGPYSVADAFGTDNPFVVSGDVIGTMVVDFTNRVADEGGDCHLAPPDFDFR